MKFLPLKSYITNARGWNLPKTFSALMCQQEQSQGTNRECSGNYPGIKHRISQFGRNLQRMSCPTPCTNPGQLNQAAQSLLQSSSEPLWLRTLGTSQPLWVTCFSVSLPSWQCLFVSFFLFSLGLGKFLLLKLLFLPLILLLCTCKMAFFHLLLRWPLSIYSRHSQQVSCKQ